ncbi:hypothetical protein [Tolypothrix sp. VBCCA 56010]|uniref:hypothetical protein n=1 Tax=Tolypothrix sp. VBCCA 56010 TaxID=3137731 RepID=UPI003D7E1B04
MIDESTVKLTIFLKDLDLDDEELDKLTRNLRREIEEFGEEADFVQAEQMPEGAKSFGGFLLGVLRTEVSVGNFKKLLGFLGDRLGNKTIELEVEANGKKLKVKASSQQELTAAIEQAQKFIAGN